MIKVLRIINRFNLGGPSFNAAYLTKYLAPDFETLLVGGKKQDTEDSSEFILHNLGIQPIVIDEMQRSISLKNDKIAYNKIRQIIKEFKPDIVHTHASKAGTIGRLAAIHEKVPIIVHTFHGHVFHSYFGRVKTTVYKTIERQLAKKTSSIIAISEQQKYELANVHKICPPDKITVVPLGFDLQRFQDNQVEKRSNFRSLYQIAPNEVAIGIIGRLVPVKNHAFFLEAIARVKSLTNKKIRVFVVGDGELKTELENLCTALNLDFSTTTQKPATIHFTSWIREVDEVLAGMDIVALSSLNEGTPVSIIEAQAANKPIVSTAVGGIQNAVWENQTAFLSAVGDIESYVNHLKILINDENLRQEMGAKGWDFVASRFHYTRLVNDVRNLYLKLLQTHHAAK